MTGHQSHSLYLFLFLSLSLSLLVVWFRSEAYEYYEEAKDLNGVQESQEPSPIEIIDICQ